MAVTASRQRIAQAEGHARPRRNPVVRLTRWLADLGEPPPPPYAMCAGCRRTSYQATLYRPRNGQVWQCARCLGDPT